MKKVFSIIACAAALLISISTIYSCTPSQEDPSEQKPEEGGGDNGDPNNGGNNGGNGGNNGGGQSSVSEADWKSFKKVSSFPVVRITTASTIQKDEYTTGTIVFEDPDGMYSSVPTLTVTMRIKGRGNTTWSNPKKPYRIKLDEKNKVFGMKGNKDWVLLANYNDKTLLRNQVAMEISRIVNMTWTPKCRAAEVYLNGSYQGLYDVFQKVEVAGEKVNITPVTASDNSGDALTGDYFLEIDTAQDEPVCFVTEKCITPLMFKEPDQPTSAQQTYLKSWFAEAEDVLKGSNFNDPENGYRKYLDADSFIKYYIVQELTKNIDGGFRKSSFGVKYKNGKFAMVTAWDFDLSLGNANYFDSQSYNDGVSNDYSGWWVKEYGRKGKGGGYFPILFNDPAFVADLKAKWNELKPELDKVPDMIDGVVELYGDAIDRNFDKWQILGTYVWPNVVVLGSYDKELDYMKEFYTKRLAWLDENINKL